ncbi:unnamed protein product [Oikopleura dioica]|uniref:Flotillin n=1 Tax=Oikopleura dioica TaxID=34765 RepID=E4X0S9_OIKDI|nr:unnamed protein product [Oikopleura dioica]
MGFETCGPNEAMVVSGCGKSEPETICGGRAWVWPIVQKVQRLSLNAMTLQIKSVSVNTKQGVPISCIGIAQIKIGSEDKDLLNRACMHFLGKNEEEIRHIALETMEGHQRAIMGTMTVEEIYQDRKSFSEQVFEVSITDMHTMGITVVSYTLKDIHDNHDYLASLGRGQTALVKRDARKGEAEAKMNSAIKESHAEKERMESKFENDTAIAESQRDFDLRKAMNDQEIQTQKAISDLATKLQEALTKQQVKNAEMEVKMIERKRQIELQDQEILRKQKELEARVKKPAEAEKYKLEVEAEATRLRMVLEAEAEAEQLRLQGEAKAYAIQEKAKAEADQMRKKAAAWNKYKDAAIVDMVLETLPKIAEEIADPLAQSGKITMVCTGNGEIGASRLTGEILDVVARLPKVVESMTGHKLASY